jgi:putative endonuclease
MALEAPGSLVQIMKFHVYILWSEPVGRYYVGSTSNLMERFAQHNRGQSKYTLTGRPWKLIWNQECTDRTQAIFLENKIKKRGIKRFLEDSNFDFSGSSAAR